MAEYGGKQRNQLCKVISRCESKDVQLQRFVDNRSQTDSQLNLIHSIQKGPNNTKMPDNLKYSIDDVKGHYNSNKSAQLNDMQQDVKHFNNRLELIVQRKLHEIANNELPAKHQVMVYNNTAQLARRKKKLSLKAEANRRRLLDKQNRKYSRWFKQQKAEEEFHVMVGTDAVDQHKFPFDNFNTSETIDQAMDRLPIGMRNSEKLREIIVLPDAAHGQESERKDVKKGELQEALAGWHFSSLRALTNVKSKGPQIDFAGTDQQGREVPFDPFMSPLSAEGKDVSDKQKDTWAQKSNAGSYYKHTHGKGGDPDTVGVWDQTYSSEILVADLKGRLQKSGANLKANVHELRVPLDEAIAREHIAAEEQIERSKKEAADKMKRWEEVKKRYNKAQRRKPKNQRLTFEEALIDDSQLGRYWRTQV